MQPQPKVIMLSALEDPQLKETLDRKKLVDGFFNKPVQSDLLQHKIQDLFKIWFNIFFFITYGESMLD